MADYFRVKEPFAYGNAVATAGEIWSSDNPNLKGREQFFEPLADAVTRTAARASETASAAPGEVRARKPLPKKAAPKIHTEPKGDA
ncbi:hypothetical protein AO501_25270 [Mycobacterium gordonae]|uniref:Uncharacterized protein n=1 Tax=Mycobacterium gordonae TaxID=1778 RepID=A0A0Q2QU84_MYCGO|nr:MULTISPECIES: hypothetical protein [Mycobacterium]KQH75590.1 hypothetical protein AO501_25270 [Mycobacterium gordonae]MDP7732092.1 hypothetical protein [Mycobacterium sp. TY813]